MVPRSWLIGVEPDGAVEVVAKRRQPCETRLAGDTPDPGHGHVLLVPRSSIGIVRARPHELVGRHARVADHDQLVVLPALREHAPDTLALLQAIGAIHVAVNAV